MNMGIVAGLIKALAPGVDPDVIDQAVTDWLDDHPEATTTVQDGSITEEKLAQDVLAELAEIDGLKEAIVPLTPAATSGDVGKFMKVKTVSGGKVTAYEFGSAGGGGSVDLNYVTPEEYGAVGDGETDDYEAVQAACNAGYAVYFANDKTYYVSDTIEIDHDCHLFGGENTVIKTKTPSGGTVNNGIYVQGTLKKTTTLTSDYSKNGDETENAGDRFKLTDMTGISIGDLMVIQATDQFYSYCRNYYYLGGNLLVCDIADGYLWTCDALPFDIENTENVTVSIYDAPSVIVENLHFVSDHDSAGNYRYMLLLENCKNSVIENVDITESDNGIKLVGCVNTLVNGATISKMPLSGTGRVLDHYGITVHSCTDTVIERVYGNAANSCIDITGTIPNINTYIRHCNLFALSRFQGLGMHENAYNTVVEDCIIGGFQAFGTVFVNRCRFVRSYRYTNQSAGIAFRGSHIAECGRLIVTNCVFDSVQTPIAIPTPSTQDNPPQAFDHIIDEIIIENCTGGMLQYAPTTTEYVLSNKINRLTIRNWHNCKEVYHTSAGAIDEMLVENSQFNHKIWMNDHENHLATDGIKCLRLKSDCSQIDKMYVHITQNGGMFYLPANATVNCSSSTQTDIYQVCGKNMASNSTGDWEMGTVGGWEGDTLTRTKDNRYSSALSVVSNELVWTQPNNSDKTALYPKCLVYVPAGKRIKMSCKLKNTGDTTGATFRPYLAVVDCATGLISYRNNHGTVTASSTGELATHERLIENDSLVLCFLHNSTVVQGSETTISEFVIEVVSDDFPDVTFEQYTGSSRTGDGTLQSVEGMNNILINAAGAFNVKFKADLMERQ